MRTSKGDIIHENSLIPGHLTPVQRVKKDIYNGVFHDAFLPTVISDEKLLGFPSEEEAAYLSLQLIIGAADTVSFSKKNKLSPVQLTQPKEQDVDMVIP